MITTTRFIVLLMQALGGLMQARRALLVCAVAAGFVSPPVVVAQTSGNDPGVHVTEKDGVYQVSATFSVPHPVGLITSVLTDYDRIPEFMPDVTLSRVRERAGGRTVVEQEAVAKVLFFSRRIHLTLEVTETPGVIQFRDTCGRSFVRYEGAWKMSEDGARSRVTYELVAKPTSDVPAVFVRRLLSRDVQKTIGQLRQEMLRRVSTATAVSAR